MKSSQDTEKHDHHDHDHSHGHSHSHSGLIPLRSLLDPSPAHKKKLDIQALREKLAAGRGPAFWRTLDEAAESEDLREYIEEEFPALTGEIPQGIDRRNLLKVMAASLAMAGAAACTKQPKELIVPYVRQPENVIPGLPLFYATAMPAQGYARGLLVESHLNRPTKIEGNPDHPASLGSTTVFEQGSILNLYDPDRSETVLHAGRLSTWSDFTIAFNTEAQNILARKGEGLAILSGVCTSPTLINQITSVFQGAPAAKWYVHEPSVNPALASAARKIAGRNAFVSYDLSQADVIVSLDSDFLNNGPAALLYARQFSRRRKAIDNGQTPVRLYAVEAGPTVSGSLADHHFPMESSKIPAIAYRLAKACGAAAPDVTEAAPEWLSVVAQDLQASKGRCVIIPGEYQPESVHLAAYAANAALGNVGKTVKLLESVEPNNTRSIEELTNDLNSGRIETLVILGSNPVYTAPASLNFVEAIRKARLVVRLGNFYDETSHYSHWHIPEAHYLETWSDSRAFDGTVTIQQPLVEPLYGGKSAHEVISIL
ncbi:MAG: TAT-variant-translocated molybdopterin oxidoreductase, partial [Acidobacteriaceae bacterium]|nr:TAT-variant-translocated molybdopterin oxidoreductase [Acidobacteriaceae bacterium]